MCTKHSLCQYVDSYDDIFFKVTVGGYNFFEVNNGKIELESLAYAGAGMQKSSDRS